MLKHWRRDLLSFLLFAQVALAGLALELDEPHVWRAVLPVAACLNLLGWLMALRVVRAIEDTPTSRVASAAQGYVELQGRAQPNQGQQLLTPHTQLPCLWYRYLVEREEDNKWRHVDSAVSEAPFDLVDASGRCTIEPAGAHVDTTHKEERREGDLRHTEWVLLKEDSLYALGAFNSDRPEQRVLNARVDEGELLAEWKEDAAELKRRFDLDGDGEISAKEWMLARQAARREIARRHQAIRAEAARHTLRKPADGRPFLISNLAPDGLGRRYQLMSRGFLILMLGCLGGLTYILKMGG